MEEYNEANLRNNEKYKILMEKIQLADEERIAISNTLTTLKTENQRFNDILNNKLEELKHYEYLVSNNNRLETEAEKLINKETDIDDELEKDKFLIYDQLEKVASETYIKLNNMYPSKEKKDTNSNTETLLFKVICVIFVDVDNLNDYGKPNLYYHTFRNDLETTVNDIIESSCRFWDMIDQKDKFILKYMDDNKDIRKIEESKNTCVDKYLKSLNGIKIAKIVLVKRDSKFSDIEIDDEVRAQDEKQKKNLKQTKKIYGLKESTKKFLSIFVGVVSYMIGEFNKILCDTDKKNKEKEEIEITKFSFKVFWYLLGEFTYFLLFLFTILSLFYQINNESTYYSVNILKNYLSIGKDDYLSNEDLKNDIVDKLSIFFLKDDIISGLDMTNINEFRISIYKTKQKECLLYLNESLYSENPNEKCYYTYYDSYTNDNTKRYTKLKEQYNLKSNSNEYVIKQTIELEYPLNNTLSEDLLYEYYDDIYENFAKEKDETDQVINLSYNIKGRMGVYDGNGFDIFISPPFINQIVFKDILSNVIDTNNEFWDSAIIGVVINFVLYNPNDKIFFWINMIYDRPSNSLLPATIEVYPFLLNVWDNLNGNQILIADIVRIILILIVCVYSFQEFSSAKQDLHETERDIINIILLIFQPKLMCTFLLIIFYILVFIYKISYLNEDLSLLFIQNSSNKFLKLIRKEFYWEMIMFQRVLLIESLMIITILLRLIFVILEFKRFRTIYDYIRKSFRSIMTYFIIVILFLLCFSIFAQNLWGENYRNYTYIDNCMLSLLLLSIGNFKSDILKNSNFFWNTLFIFLFFFIFIYFMLQSFVGLYLEDYRITSLKKGYTYDNRKTKENEN